MRVLWDGGGEYVVILTGISQFATDDPGFEGFAQRNGRLFQWEAFPKPDGYYVKVYRNQGYIGAVQGATLNLALEVMAAIKQIG